MSRVYLLAGAVAVGCYLAFPPVVGSTWLFELVGFSTVVAIAVGIIRYRPQPRLPWVLFMLAQLLFLAGDLCYYTFNVSFPSFADGAYIGYYPLQAAGLLLLVRRRTPGRDTAGLLDALLLTVGFGLLAWIYLIEPYGRTDDSKIAHLVSMAYPVMDVLLLAVAARLVMGNGSRPRAFHLMMASIACLIVTDAVYGWIELNGSYISGSYLDVGWMTTYLLWGAAALHPSMRQLSERQPAVGPSLSGQRMLLLAAATLVAPTTLLINEWWPIAGFDLPVVATTSAVLFVLVMVRILGLVASLRDAVSRHERAERRETVLRHVASALTAAPDREVIRRTAFAGACDLVEDLADVQIAVDICDDAAPALLSTSTAADALVVSMATQASTYGRLVVTSTTDLPTDVVDGLHTLGSQVALALEAAALTERMSQQRSEARVGALVQNSSDMILVLDADLVIRYVTPSVAQALGHRPDGLVGTPITALVGANDQDVVRGFYSALAGSPGRSVSAEWRMRRADGRFTDMESVSTNLLDNPSVKGIVVTAHDITERKAYEDGLQHQVNELEELDRIRSEFVATVSHELRTPLTSIIGEVELLTDGDRGDLTGCQTKGVEAIGRNSERLLSLIDDLLTLNHIETSTLDLHREPTPVAGLVEDVRSQLRSVAEAKSVDLAIGCGPEVGSILVDRQQLDRALSNLLTNAVKFTPAGGTVALVANRVGPDVVFTVSDTGVGIPEDEQDRLFTRFFRSSVATELAIQGTGLGLVIVKRIVEEHGGTIAIDSARGVGTTVTVTIPVGRAPGARADAA